MPRKPKKNPAAVELGRKGGSVRNPKKGFGSLTPEERSKRAKAAVAKRWAKAKRGGKAK